MKYHIEKQGNEVVISFDALDSHAQLMIDAIGRCRQSAWACSSGECMKIADMETCAEGEALTVRLRPRADAALSVVSLGECLKYQLPKEIQACSGAGSRSGAGAPEAFQGAIKPAAP